jgi:hypothetical protein
MTVDLFVMAHQGIILVTTYILHSTLVLGGTWLAFAVARPQSYLLRERVWRWAAVLPLITVPIQLVWVDDGPWMAWTFEDPVISVQSDAARDATSRARSDSVTDQT